MLPLLTPASIFAGLGFLQRNTDAKLKAINTQIEGRQKSTDAQIAAQKNSTEAQIAAINTQIEAQKKSTDAQIAAVKEVAAAYLAILQKLEGR